MRKVIAFIGVSIFCLSGIGFLFWQQELQYIGPTPKPSQLKILNSGDPVDLSAFNILNEDKPLFIHFYNYDCPCSRFNAREFRNMVYKFQEQVQFVAAVQSSSQDTEAIKEFSEKYGLGIPIFNDQHGALADELGVYSTPQAVLIKEGKIYYKGNYNKARFCTSRNTKFTELALQALINNEPPPMFPEVAYTAYGCELPSNGNVKTSLFSLF